MKSSFIIGLLLFGSYVYGQTDSTERAAIYNKLISKEIEQNDFSKLWPRWNQAINEFKKYPDLPLDQNKKVHYSFLNKFPDFKKELLFNRTLEWLSINYGLIPEYIYSSKEDGKIIFRNSVDLKTGNTCTYTSVISIKDEKILMEIINIGYQTYYEGYYLNEKWIPEKTVNQEISHFYPVILKKPLEWSSILGMFKATNEFFNTETGNLCDYIISYDSTYVF